MDCIHARLVIVLNRREPNQLDGDARAALDQHLEQCAACQAWSHQEDRVDETLRKAMHAVPVPAKLPSKILHELERRPPVRRGPWIAAAAACLLLALGSGGYFWLTQRPELHFADIKEVYVAHNSPELVEERFADLGVTIIAPPQFNYDLYTDSSLHLLKNRQVPRIDFFHRGDQERSAAEAHVYVIPEDQFDVQELIDRVPSPTPVHGDRLIEILRGENGFLYIVVYTGGSLRPFLLRMPNEA